MGFQSVSTVLYKRTSSWRRFRRHQRKQSRIFQQFNVSKTTLESTLLIKQVPWQRRRSSKERDHCFEDKRPTVRQRIVWCDCVDWVLWARPRLYRIHSHHLPTIETGRSVRVHVCVHRKSGAWNETNNQKRLVRDHIWDPRHARPLQEHHTGRSQSCTATVWLLQLGWVRLATLFLIWSSRYYQDHTKDLYFVGFKPCPSQTEIPSIPVFDAAGATELGRKHIE